jgi:microcystin-dependent protein
VSNPYVGEIRIFGGSFAPAGWMFCAGQLLPISEYDVLFNLIGTTYGGDGQSTFALPDLQGRIPLHQGSNAGTTFTLGESGGVESVTLTTNQLPAHTHPFLTANVSGDQINPSGNLPSQSQNVQPYVNADPDGNMGAAITPTGGNQPHENLQPYLTLSFIISLFGIFPSQT